MKKFAIVQQPDELPDHVDFIKETLAERFERYQAYLANPKHSSTKAASRFYHTLAEVHDAIMQQQFLLKPSLFQTQQTCLFTIIYDANNKFTNADKLFFEFLIGLTRFSLALTLSSLYFSNLNVDKKIDFQLPPITDSFLDYLYESAKRNETLVNQVAKHTHDFASIDFWQSAADFFTANPKLEKLARLLTAIHYVPNDSHDREIIGLAQMLHWNGFGGSGELIQHIDLLQPLLNHCVGYHKRHLGGFNPRFSIILQLHDTAEKYALPIITTLLCNQYPVETVIDILDVGSGPQFLAVADVIQQLFAAKRNVRLTAADVDTQSIRALLKLQPSTDFLHEVRLLDLNLVDQIDTREKNSYDVVTARLVLHQLATEDITKAFRLFIQLVRPNGYIVNGDVSTANYFQTLLVPCNLIDREGYVPSWKHFNILKTAVSINDSMSKIAIPLVDVDKNFPSDEIPMRNFMVYQIYCVPSNEIENLQKLWEHGDYRQVQITINNISY
jgi:hypothetical protein